MKYEWLLFDADGTLFDYERAEANALQNAFDDFNLPFDLRTANTYRQINRQIWIDFENKRISSTALRTRRFELLFKQLGIPIDAEKFSSCYLYHLSQGSDLVTGAKDTIEMLHGKFRLGIITNGLKDVQRPRLEGSQIAGLFDVIGISEEIGAVKPDPAFFEAVFAQIGSPTKDRVLVIGDSLTSDIHGSNLFGLDSCWYNPSKGLPDPRYPATYEIDSLPQLIRLVHDNIGTSQ